jgi:hypothetical protein
MRFAKDHRRIPICMKIHPKVDISLLLFAILGWIIISQSIEIVLALGVVHWTSPMVLRSSLSNWRLHPKDNPLKISYGVISR